MPVRVLQRLTNADLLSLGVWTKEDKLCNEMSQYGVIVKSSLVPRPHGNEAT